MKIDTISDLNDFVDDCLDDALEAAKVAGLATLMEATFNARVPERYVRKEASLSLVQHDDYQDAPIYFCEKAWGVVLSVDLRQSTKRAMKIGPQKTFITMHVFMRTLIRLVEKAKGRIIGLRGDGLLALFGHKPFEGDDADLKTEESDKAIIAATGCGDAMIRAVQNVVNPGLRKKEIPGDLRIGVGIEPGKMVITKIGLQTAYDVTAYGTCVNRAVKISDESFDKVLIGRDGNLIFPTSDGGKIKVRRYGTDLFEVIYPNGSNLN